MRLMRRAGDGRDRRRAFARVVALPFVVRPLRMGLACGIWALNPLSAVASALLLRRLIDAAAAHDHGAAVEAALLLSVAAGATLVSSWIGLQSLVPIIDDSLAEADTWLIRLAMTIPGLSHLEDPEYHDRLAMIRTLRMRLAGAAQTVTLMLSALVALIATAAALATVNAALLSLFLFGAVPVVFGSRAQARRREGLAASVPRRRQADHLFRLATRAASGRELRIYGFRDRALSRHGEHWSEAAAAQDRSARAALLLTAAGWLVFGLAFLGALALVVWQASRGRSSAGDLVLVLALGTRVNLQVASLVQAFTSLFGAMDAAQHLRWLEDYRARPAKVASRRSAVPQRIAEGIELRGVRFRYPSGESDVLRGVDLFLPAGSVVALVGENGAGKSTLVNLLYRFYEPSEGAIEVDGIELGEFDLDEWRRACTADFQDFLRPELVLREAVGIGDLTRLDDERVVAVALDRAGAEALPRSLPLGLNTMLGTGFDGGADLSGGQWQKVALARALMRPAPLVFVLDEPASGLDAKSEHELFTRQVEASRAVARRNATITLLVSHRFSTVRMADHIAVLEGGVVTEQGGHRDLLATGGRYAELFERQARGYR